LTGHDSLPEMRQVGDAALFRRTGAEPYFGLDLHLWQSVQDVRAGHGGGSMIDCPSCGAPGDTCVSIVVVVVQKDRRVISLACHACGHVWYAIESAVVH
jgi:hypothetical protein